MSFAGQIFADSQGDKDFHNYYHLTQIKASLMPIQQEVLNTEKPPAKEFQDYYDKVAKGYNDASDAWQVLVLAKKLGVNTHTARKNFEKKLKIANELSGKILLSRGFAP